MTHEDARKKVDGVLGDTWLGFNNDAFRDALAAAIMDAVAEERERCANIIKGAFGSGLPTICQRMVAKITGGGE